MLYFRHLPVILLSILIYIPIFVRLLKLKSPLEKHIITAAFYVYIAMVVNVAFFPIPVYEQSIEMFRMISPEIDYNIIPLSTIIETIRFTISYDGLLSNIIRLVGYNILMFVPMGYLLPLVTKRIASFSKVVIWAFGISLLIECLQLLFSILYGFTFRYFNVDDIILNTLGGTIGFVLLKATLPILKKYIRLDF